MWVCLDCLYCFCSEFNIQHKPALKNKCIYLHSSLKQHYLFYCFDRHEFYCFKCSNFVKKIGKFEEFYLVINKMRNYQIGKQLKLVTEDTLRTILYAYDRKMLKHNQFHMTDWCLCTESKCEVVCQWDHEFERPGRIFNIHKRLMRHYDFALTPLTYSHLDKDFISYDIMQSSNPQLNRLETLLDFFDESDYLDPMLKGKEPVKLEKDKSSNKLKSSVNKKVWCTKFNEKDIYENKYTYSTLVLETLILEKLADSLYSPYRSYDFDGAFANIRPPGHHAGGKQPIQGFCFLNNVVYLINYIKSVWNPNIKVAVVDWDIHHGDGVQKSFYKRKDVLYLSIHRHDAGNYFPNCNTGHKSCVGEEDGLGYNLNLTWDVPEYAIPKKGDAKINIKGREYVILFKSVIMPMLREFSPDLIVVCCGFDACDNDPLGECKVEPPCYEWMTRQLCSLGTKVVCTLEGGYNINNLEECAQGVINGLLSQNITRYPDKKWKYKDWYEKHTKYMETSYLDNIIVNQNGYHTKDLWIDQQIFENIKSCSKLLGPQWKCLQMLWNKYYNAFNQTHSPVLTKQQQSDTAKQLSTPNIININIINTNNTFDKEKTHKTLPIDKEFQNLDIVGISNTKTDKTDNKRMPDKIKSNSRPKDKENSEPVQSDNSLYKNAKSTTKSENILDQYDEEYEENDMIVFNSVNQKHSVNYESRNNRSVKNKAPVLEYESTRNKHYNSGLKIAVNSISDPDDSILDSLHSCYGLELQQTNTKSDNDYSFKPSTSESKPIVIDDDLEIVDSLESSNDKYPNLKEEYLTQKSESYKNMSDSKNKVNEIEGSIYIEIDDN